MDLKLKIEEDNQSNKSQQSQKAHLSKLVSPQQQQQPPQQPADSKTRMSLKTYTSTTNARSLEKEFDETMSKFTKESGKFFQWMSLPPHQRSPDAGRTTLGDIVKQIDIIRSMTSNSGLGIEKQVERIVHLFQKIEFKSEEVLPPQLIQQVTTCLILIAGTIKAMIAMHILEKRKQVLSAKDSQTDIRKVFRFIIVGQEGKK